MKNKVLEMLISAALGTALGLAFTGVMPAMAADTNSNTVTQQVMEISDSETDNADTAGSLSVEPSSSSLADSTVQEDEYSSANREKSDTPESDEAEESTADFDDVTDSSKETILEEEQSSEPSPSDIKSNKTGKKTMALLDETDIEILHSLQKDAKINAKELSEKLHISKTPIYERIKRLENEGYIKGYVALVDNKKIGLPLIIFCNVSLAVHDDEHIERFKEEIRNIDEIMECYSTGGIYDFFVKVVLKDLDAYNQFVFEKLTKVHGIVKMQSSFVLNEIKHTTVLNIPKNS